MHYYIFLWFLILGNESCLANGLILNTGLPPVQLQFPVEDSLEQQLLPNLQNSNEIEAGLQNFIDYINNEQTMWYPGQQIPNVIDSEQLDQGGLPFFNTAIIS